MTEQPTDAAFPPEPHGSLTIRTLAMPADTNPAGDIFGGWVMSQMDIAGAIAAVEAVGGRVVTVAVEAMTFIAPVKVGDVLCVYTSVERIGRTSITIAIEAWARRNRVDDRVQVTQGRWVYVALGEDGSKRVISE
ncbi:acyl-CoA thioesterase [Devosia pacifica]|uniref:Acyl-CoA thioesterase n=1 Tax=Devosia pacifica TaxID=1335967 RepID=A0A918RZA8_9HYPH|nr:acyl-CoA thioesterase [Devosia pacifica]GHA16829.1 acyl-CoA thioesterase [Devosia pacifica]